MNLVGCLPPWFTSRKEKICQSEFKVSSAVRDQLELEFYDLISDREIVMKKKCLKPCQKMIIKVMFNCFDFYKLLATLQN